MFEFFKKKEHRNLSEILFLVKHGKYVNNEELKLTTLTLCELFYQESTDLNNLIKIVENGKKNIEFKSKLIKEKSSSRLEYALQVKPEDMLGISSLKEYTEKQTNFDNLFRKLNEQ